MGTNYYLVKNGPTVNYGPYHIGKSSIGWMFNFQEQNEPWGDWPVVWHTYPQVKQRLYDLTVANSNFVIMNEYDEIVSYNDFIELVERKQSDPHCKSNPDNFSFAKNIDGYRFTDQEFL